MPTNAHIPTGASAAWTTFLAKHQELMAGPMTGAFNLYCEEIPSDGKIDVQFLANLPVMREWVGPRQEKEPRHYSYPANPRPKEATMPFFRQTISRDRIGIVARAIAQFFDQAKSAYDRTAATARDSNSGTGDTGYDAVAIYSASHPHVNSGAGGSNLGSLSLTHANFTATRASMRGLKLENGDPAGVMPTHMRVGTVLETRAKEILEAKGVIKYTDVDGSETSGGSTVQNATYFDNVWQGELQLYVDERISTSSYYWDLDDLSKGSNRPFALVLERPFEALTRDQMTDPERWENDRFLFGLEGDWVVVPAMWMLTYRQRGTD